MSSSIAAGTVWTERSGLHRSIGLAPRRRVPGERPMRAAGNPSLRSAHPGDLNASMKRFSMMEK
jgi:hypothetical protein